MLRLSYLLEYDGVFELLRDRSYFARLTADREAGTIVWPNGADIAPETLYARAQQHAAAGQGRRRSARWPGGPTLRWCGARE